MPHYHLFFVSDEVTHSIDSAIFDAPDHAAAMALIAEGAFQRPLELWSGFERIQRFESVPANAAPPPLGS